MTLHGLTTRQCEIADMLWACDTQDDMIKLMKKLPKQDRTTAQTLVIMMIQDSLEGQVEKAMKCS